MAKPEIGLSMLYCLNKPFPHLLKYLGEVDVNHVEIPDEGLHALNQRRVRSLKETAKAKNLDLIVHAPWAGVNIAVPNPALRRAVLKRLKKSISYAKQLDCRLWLFHPGSKTALSHIYPGKDWQLNLKSVRALLRAARREGVEVAIENIPEPYPNLMKSTADFQRFYEELDDNIGMVLDVAHANLNGQIQDFMKQFHERIVHMHVSDNDGTNDLHLGLGYGNINWENLAKTVKEAEYGNLIVLESTDHVKESLQALHELFGLGF
jgi:sugar phosphate isomerase/epimerase